MIILSFGSDDEHKSEFRFFKSYVFTIGAMPFSRGWDVEPSTGKARLAFAR
jgi:hypothetical protein